MATKKSFSVKSGLDANANSISNLGVSSASLTLSGANAVTLTSTGTTNVTLPVSGTLLYSGGALGTPASGNLTNCTFPTLNQNTSGTAAGLSSTLVATSGGTGQSSYAIGDILYASTTTALSKLTAGTSGYVLTSGGAGVAPSWGAAGAAAAGSLTGSTLASGVTASSLTSVGTIGTGVWQGSAIADTYLSTISTSGKVSNSATTATSANTASAIVARDASGNFTAGTITASLTGNVSGSSGSCTGNAATATKINSQGDYTNAAPGTTRGPTGLNLYQVYSNGYPTTYGNLLHMYGAGAGQLLVGWSGTDGADAGVYVRSKRDNDAGAWSAWREFITAANIGSQSVTYATSAGSITSQANSATITATSANTASQIVLRDASGNFSANVITGTATSARYADLAENYTSDQSYDYGIVLMIGGDEEVTIATEETQKLAGVVSKNPAYLMNSECEGNHVVAIALQGRTPVRVMGKVNKGDFLVSAGNGYAKATDNPRIGSIIGKSLESFDGQYGMVEAMVGRL
jgi:hypothetical protein